MEDRYMSMDIPYDSVDENGERIRLSVIVKLDDEGVIIDLVEQGYDEPLDSAWKLYSDLGLEVKEFNKEE